MALACLAISGGAASAQGVADGFRGERFERDPVPAWEGDLMLLGVNTALGGFTAGLLQEFRGGSFWEAFRDGALGGATVYAGKRISVEQFSGAGLLGREVAALGASVVRNASEGRPAWEQVVLPVGPVRLYLRGGGTGQRGLQARVKLDVASLLATGYIALQSSTTFDVGESISSGMPVFSLHAPSSEADRVGYQAAGVVWRRRGPSAAREAGIPASAVLAHERVHVLQYDFGLLVWSDPVEERITDELPGGDWMDRHLDWGLFLAAWGLANRIMPYHLRPWEQEAHFLGRIPIREE